MGDFLSLGVDSDFLDFNYSEVWDPALRLGSGPKESDLYRLACQARLGDGSASFEFADTMEWTLREESFAVFQQVHGPRPIEYASWFHAKLEQLLGILLYEELKVEGVGPQGFPGPPETERPWEEGTGVLSGKPANIQPDVIEQAFSPQDSRAYDWGILVRRLLAVGDNRLAAFEQLLEERNREREERSVAGGPAVTEAGAEGTSVKPRKKQRRVTMERDSIIASCLSRDMPRWEICRVLDQKGISTTAHLQKNRLTRWQEAWEDSRFHNNVQQIITKTKNR